jgi:hypothetical protein
MANEVPEALVTENLKTLRLLHQLLMVVAAAILVFALRADLSKDYKAALDELAALKETPFETWGTFIAERYNTYESQNDKFVRDIVQRASLPLQGNPNLNEPVFGDVPPYKENAKLLQLDAFISGNQKIGVLKLNADKQAAAEQLKRLVAARNPHPVVSGMWLSGFAGGYGQQILDWRNPPLVPTLTLNFNINDQPQTTPNQPVWVVVSFSIFSEKGHFAADWLKGDSFGHKLMDPNTGQVFPHLKTFWEKLNALNVEEATVFLQEQLEASTRGTLSFFGIPVERSLAISAGPIVSFSILLFLCLHIRHFRSIAVEIDSVPRYPFFLLFRGAMGALLVTYATVLVLPVLANEELLRRFGNSDERSTKWGAVFAFLVAVTGVWTIIEIHLLRRRWFRV